MGIKVSKSVETEIKIMQGEISAYKLIGIRCSKSLKAKLFAGGKQFSGPHFDRSQIALTYLIKIGEQKSWSWFKKLRRSKNFACLSRSDLPQSTFSGSRKIETVGLSRYRSFPFQTGPPNSKVCKVAPRTSCIDVGFLLFNWKNLRPYSFPPLALIERVLAKSILKNCEMILVTPVWPSQLQHIQLLMLTTAGSLLIPRFSSILVKLDGLHQYSQCQNQTKSIAAWKIPGKLILQKIN